MLKRHRSVSSVLPHDVVEMILERLPVKSLRRFRSVSKNWRRTIDSRRFRERQWNRRRQARGPDVLFVSLFNTDETEMVVGSSSFVRTVRFPLNNLLVSYGTCDGLVCLYCMYTPRSNVVVNPATQWHRSFPFSRIQQIISERCKQGANFEPTSNLGFGKDEITGTYKPVWLYNSSEFGLDNVTTCEVFDFSTNAWRYVVPASPYRMLHHQKPVYLDGSLYWLTEDSVEETKVLSFDLHAETFQVVSKAPFANHHVNDPFNVIMCVLDNRLCLSEKNWPTQVIWSLDDSGSWKKLCEIDLTITLRRFKRASPALLPVAILDKNKLLLHGRIFMQPLMLHDLRTKSYVLVSQFTTPGYSLHYFESLFSV